MKIRSHPSRQKTTNLTLGLLLIVGLLFLSSCTGSHNDKTYVEFANPAVKFKQNIAPRSSDTNTVDSFIVTIDSIEGKRFQTVDTFKLSDTVKINVPANIALIISGKAYLNETLLYSGEVTINPIRPGFGAKLTLLLQDLSQANEKVQIDTTPTTTQSNPTKPSLGVSFSRDNDYVLFISDEDNLVSNDTNKNADVFIRNLSTNVVTLIHADGNGVIGNASSERITVDEADISADGLYAVFASYSDTLVPSNANGSKNVFLKNTSSGEISQLSIHESSTSTNLDSYNPQISDDGNTITFYSKARIISSASDTIFIVNRFPFQIAPLPLSDVSDNYKLSGDGKFIVYQSKADKSLKLVKISEDISQSLAGALSLNRPETISRANINYNFSINQTGQFVLFIADETIGDLVKDQHYLYDNLTHKTTLVSKTRKNTEFSGVLAENTIPAISNDGRYVAFAYDNITYIRSVAFDNLVEVGSGIHPFLSSKGDRLGFEFEDNLFFVNNPLYFDSVSPAQKAIAPANFNLQETNGRITLSWDKNPNASYYRVYFSNQANITSKLGSQLFNPEFFETNNSTYESFSPARYNYRNFYFVVFAIDENGEGIASTEVRYIDTYVRSGEGSLLNPMPITLPYALGATNDDKSYYKFTIPQSANVGQAFQIKVAQTGVGVDNAMLTLTDSNPNTSINCSSVSSTCNIVGVNEMTEFVLIVDGEDNSDITYTISLTSALSIDAKFASSINFDLAAGGSVVIINSLESNTDYHLSDLTNADNKILYRIINPSIPMLSCAISINVTPNVVQDDCVFTSDANGEIFFELSASLDDFPITDITRNFQLDLIRSQAFDVEAQLPNKIIITDEKIAKFTNLDPLKEYYIALTALSGGAKYQVNPNLFFNNASPQAHCKGKLNVLYNDLDSCAFKPLADGKIVVHLKNTSDDTSIDLEIFELSATNIIEVADRGSTFIPANRIVFLKFLYDGADFIWRSLEIEFPIGTSGTITTYDNLSAMPTCQAELTLGFQVSACEFINNGSYLIAFDFSQNAVDTKATMNITTRQILTREIAVGTNLDYLDYLFAIPSALDATTPAYYIIKKSLNSTYPALLAPTMQVFNSDRWRNPVCTPVMIGANQLCITNTPGVNDNLNIKLTEFPLFPIVEFYYNADIVLEGRAANELSTESINSFLSTGEYEVFFINNLEADTKVSVEVVSPVNPTDNIPFFIVSANSDYLICESQGIEANPQIQICASNEDFDSAFVILDTSRFPNFINFNISVFNGDTPPLFP